MDRYYYSNAAYQGAMGIEPDLIIDENRKRKFPEPDRVYLIDIDPEIALKRINKRNNNTASEIFEKKDFLTNVRKIYHSIANDKFIVIDGTKNPEEIIEIIIKDIDKSFKKNK